MLSTKSVQGALRAQAERILRTLGLPCQGLESTPLDVVLFGNTTQAGKIRQTAWTYVEEIEGSGKEHTQDFVAIDRFTGGGQDGKKFNAKGWYAPRFTGELKIPKDLPDAAKGLLLLVLRDFAEGDIRLGWGTRKGYGGCVATSEGNKSPPQLLETWGQVLEAARSLASLHAMALNSQRRPAPNAQVATQVMQQRAPVMNDFNTSATTFANSTFHNPYHFIPTAKSMGSNWVERTAFKCPPSAANGQTPPHWSHAHYSPSQDFFSGQIDCKLTSETPFFVGVQRNGILQQFTANGEIAIPATSIKGLLSSLAEAASGSALRVLEHRRQITYRKQMKEALSAIGRLTQQNDGSWQLQPLAFPVMEGAEGDELPKKFDALFPPNEVYDLPAKSLVGNYIKLKSRTDPKVTTGFYDGWHLIQPKTVSGNGLPSTEYFYRKEGNPIKLKSGKSTDTNFGLGFECAQTDLLSQAQWESKAPEERKNYQRGFLRIMGKFDPSTFKEIPDDRYHEIFIPFPDGAEMPGHPAGFPTVPVAQSVVDRFNAIAFECHEASGGKFPLFPQGTRKNDPKPWEIKPNDIVFFGVSQVEENAAPVISEISHSMIWRGRVEMDDRPVSLGDFFKGPNAHVNEFVPMNPKRQNISPAEMLWGFVEEYEKNHEGDPSNSRPQDDVQAMAFAGRLFISDALPTTPPTQLEKVCLKILASPKPSSPALYFSDREEGAAYIAKNELSPGKHRAKGFKQYLHAFGASTGKVELLNAEGNVSATGIEPWRTSNPQQHTAQKVSIEPVAAQSHFKFTISFSNLSQEELDLLCFVLRPNANFRHKIGMGKSIGLGTVRLEPTGVRLIDRYKRYAQDALSEPRWNTNQAVNLAARANHYLNQAENSLAKKTLVSIGNPHNVVAPVHVPLANGGKLEEETFNWFVNNDGVGQRQHLPDISLDGALPKMGRNG